MKVLICGGIKTTNIAEALKRSLASTGIDFINTEYIEKISEVSVRGDLFDRALIFEPGWTRDGDVTNEYDIRTIINGFAYKIGSMSQFSQSEFVFISQTNEMAGIVSEEIMDISDRSALVVKAPKYSVKFIAMLATYELSDILSEYIFDPNSLQGSPEVFNDVEYEDRTSEMPENVDYSPRYDHSNMDEPVKITQGEGQGKAEIDTSFPEQQGFDGNGSYNWQDTSVNYDNNSQNPPTDGYSSYQGYPEDGSYENSEYGDGAYNNDADSADNESSGFQVDADSIRFEDDGSYDETWDNGDQGQFGNDGNYPFEGQGLSDNGQHIESGSNDTPNVEFDDSEFADILANHSFGENSGSSYSDFSSDENSNPGEMEWQNPGDLPDSFENFDEAQGTVESNVPSTESGFDEISYSVDGQALGEENPEFPNDGLGDNFGGEEYKSQEAPNSPPAEFNGDTDTDTYFDYSKGLDENTGNYTGADEAESFDSVDTSNFDLGPINTRYETSERDENSSAEDIPFNSDDVNIQPEFTGDFDEYSQEQDSSSPYNPSGDTSEQDDSYDLGFDEYQGDEQTASHPNSQPNSQPNRQPNRQQYEHPYPQQQEGVNSTDEFSPDFDDYANGDQQDSSQEDSFAPDFDDYGEETNTSAHRVVEPFSDNDFSSSVYEDSQIDEDDDDTQESLEDLPTTGSSVPKKASPFKNLKKPKVPKSSKPAKMAAKPVDDLEEIEEPHKSKDLDKDLSNQQIKKAFTAFAARGNSIVVTGCGGCGTSTVAYNLANVLCNLGYSVLLVDMDTENKTQSYISKDNYEAADPESASVMEAVNGSAGVNAYMSIVSQGFHLLSMGLASDSKKPTEAFNKERIARFANSAKTGHNFVIYDIPFEYATHHLEDVLYSADNIVITIDASNWGITKTLINMCNIGSDDMEETLFSKAQLLFNRYRGIDKLFGKKVKRIKDITKAMDKKLIELVGEDTGYYFSDLHICGSINYDDAFEDGWYNDVQYSDTKKGSEVFLQILKNIVIGT